MSLTHSLADIFTKFQYNLFMQNIWAHMTFDLVGQLDWYTFEFPKQKIKLWFLLQCLILAFCVSLLMNVFRSCFDTAMLIGELLFLQNNFQDQGYLGHHVCVYVCHKVMVFQLIHLSILRSSFDRIKSYFDYMQHNQSIFFFRPKSDRIPVVNESTVKKGLVNIFDCVSDCLITVETGLIKNIKVGELLKGTTNNDIMNFELCEICHASKMIYAIIFV